MKLYQRQELVCEKIGRETLIIDHKRGKLITLNHTASFLWENLKKPTSKEDLVFRYSEKYGKDKSKDIGQGLKNLAKAGLLK